MRENHLQHHVNRKLIDGMNEKMKVELAENEGFFFVDEVQPEVWIQPTIYSIQAALHKIRKIYINSKFIKIKKPRSKSTIRRKICHLNV